MVTSTTVCGSPQCRITSPGFVEFWTDVGPAFSRDFADWLTGIVNRRNQVSLPSHDEAGENVSPTDGAPPNTRTRA